MNEPLTLEEAMRRADVRLSRLDSVEQRTGKRPFPDGVEVVDHTDAVVCSLGTDVPGAGFVQVLDMSTEELCVAIERMGACDCVGSRPPVLTCASRIPVRGMLLRLFWLGFEFGKADEQ